MKFLLKLAGSMNNDPDAELYQGNHFKHGIRTQQFHFSAISICAIITGNKPENKYEISDLEAKLYFNYTSH